MPIAIAAGDFDNDGRYDAVSANNDPRREQPLRAVQRARDPGAIRFRSRRTPGPPGQAALRGDGNGDGRISAADLVAVGREGMDSDGFQVEAIGGQLRRAPGGRRNGDEARRRPGPHAVAHRIFTGTLS